MPSEVRAGERGSAPVDFALTSILVVVVVLALLQLALGLHVRNVLTDAAGEVVIEVPRDRAGTFEPVIVKKRQRRLSDVDAVAISLFAKEALGLDEVWWLVSPGNPLKPVDGMAPLPVRLAHAQRVGADAWYPDARTAQREVL